MNRIYACIVLFLSANLAEVPDIIIFFVSSIRYHGFLSSIISRVYHHDLPSVITEFTTLCIFLPLQLELVLEDRGGLSESSVVPKSHRGQGALFSLGPFGGSPWVIPGSLC